MRRTFFLLGFLCMTLAGCLWKTDAKAFDVERYSKEDAGYLGDAIPEEIIEKLPKGASSVIEDYLSYIEERGGIKEEEKSIGYFSLYYEIDRKTPFSIGVPYVAWNTNDEYLHYYFPMIQKGKILFFIQVSDWKNTGKTYVKGEPHFELDLELREELNEIGYVNSDFVLYYKHGVIYAENEKEVFEIDNHLEWMVPADYEEHDKKIEEEFAAKSFSEKKKAIIERVQNVEKKLRDNLVKKERKKKENLRKLGFAGTFGIGGAIVFVSLSRKRRRKR